MILSICSLLSDPNTSDPLVPEIAWKYVNNREEFRKVSVIEPVCIKQIYGLGKDSYIEGLKLLNELVI